MTREEQDKLWAEHSDEVQRDIIERYNSYDTSAPVLKALKDSLEHTYGTHNLQPKLTYGGIMQEMGRNAYFRLIDGEVYSSKEQFIKEGAIHKLLNVAKFLNKNEDGSDWVPDWEDENEIKWCPCIYQNRVKSNYMRNINKSLVHFRTEEILNQAIDILGEDTIRTALGNY